MIEKFSQQTVNSIGWYVYALADQDDRVFYIGKGQGNRVFEHVAEVKALLATDHGRLLEPYDDEPARAAELPGVTGEKRKQIAELLDANQEIRKYIIRENLPDENQALLIESVLITVLDWQLQTGLTNAIAGHGTARFGLKTVDELEATKGQSFDVHTLPGAMAMRGSTIMAINVNRRWPEVVARESSLLDISAGHWKVNKAKARTIPYVVVHALGIVRGVFEVEEWFDSPTQKARSCFKAVGDAPLVGPDYSNKNASSLFGPAGAGSQNPIRYIAMP